MSYTTRVIVVAVVLVLFALFSLGSAFDAESLLYSAEQRSAYESLKRQAMDDDADICYKVQCDVPAGNGSCTYFSNNGTVYHTCPGTDFCNSTNDCEVKFPAGHECQNSAECQIDAPYHAPTCEYNSTSDQSVCKPAKVGGFVGDECANNEDCRSGQCNTTCIGFAEFEECTEIGQCGKGLFCSNGTCMNVTETWGNCESSEECGMEWTGNGCIVGKCQAMFNVSANSTCDLHSGSECGAGYFCEPSTQTCQKHEAIECDVGNDTQCDAFHHSTCVCNHATGKGLCGGLVEIASAKAVKYYQDGVKCAKDHSCALNPQSSCLITQCSQYLDCFFAELMSALGGDPKCQGVDVKCNIHDGSSSQHGDSSSASTVGSSAAVVITALAAMAALL